MKSSASSRVAIECPSIDLVSIEPSLDAADPPCRFPAALGNALVHRPEHGRSLGSPCRPYASPFAAATSQHGRLLRSGAPAWTRPIAAALGPGREAAASRSAVVVDDLDVVP